MSYGFRHQSYTLPGFGVMEASLNNKGFDSNGNSTGTDISLNGESAIIRYRSSSNRKIVSDSYAETHKVLECYLSTDSHWEICADE